MKPSEFVVVVGIEEKMRNGIQLTVEERRYATEHKLKGPKLCGYRDCKQPFGPGEGGQYKIGEQFVCSDCYFESLGAGIEKYPVGRFRPHGSDPGF